MPTRVGEREGGWVGGRLQNRDVLAFLEERNKKIRKLEDAINQMRKAEERRQQEEEEEICLEAQ